jgi:hypothetical protein
MRWLHPALSTGHLSDPHKGPAMHLTSCPWLLVHEVARGVTGSCFDDEGCRAAAPEALHGLYTAAVPHVALQHVRDCWVIVVLRDLLHHKSRSIQSSWQQPASKAHEACWRYLCTSGFGHTECWQRHRGT